MLDQLKRQIGHADGYCELRLHNNISTTIVIRKGAIIQNDQSKLGGVSARCYHDGAFGFASFPGDSDDAMARAIGDAGDNVRLFQKAAGRHDGALPETSPGTGDFDYRTTRNRFGATERLDVAREIDARIAEKYPELLNAQIQFSSLAMEKALVTTEGAETYSYIPRSTLGIMLSVETDDGIVDLQKAFGGFGDPEEHFNDLEWLWPGIDGLYEELKAKSEGVYARAGTHDVVIDPDVAGILAHEAIGHTCEADIVLGGSVAGDMMGSTVAAEKVTLVDCAGRGPDGNGAIAIHVDDEGTPCRDVTIIENGVLREFLNNKETARIMETEPTGNGRAYEFHDEPLVRMRNTAILPGEDSLEEMIGAVEDGYYLKRSTNGQADMTSEFMFGISLGYEIRDGKIGRAIRDTTISGIAFDMLKTVTHVGDEIAWARGGMCGKKTWIPVGIGGPAIKCRINLAGR